MARGMKFEEGEVIPRTQRDGTVGTSKLRRSTGRPFRPLKVRAYLHDDCHAFLNVRGVYFLQMVRPHVY
jgi:hypothetical protein